MFVDARFYQLIDTSVPERWYLKGLTDGVGVQLDPREFCLGSPIQMLPHMRIRSPDGVPVDVRFPLRVGLRKRGVPLGFTFASFAMPVASSAVAHLLLSIDQSAIQVFPVGVESEKNNFYIINVATSPECIDRERSDVEWWGETDGQPDRIGSPKAIYDLVVDRRAVSGRHIFRVKGWEIALVVSEEVRLAFDRDNVSGVAFQEV
jgi:hypothetical protein